MERRGGDFGLDSRLMVQFRSAISSQACAVLSK